VPDASGRIPPVFFDAEAWSRVFGTTEPCDVCGMPEGDCEGEEPDCPDNETEIHWEPDLSLDGAFFISE
jgi:hypothetical protein